jgi:ribosomal peptide maturation radical SAM protein 1
MLRVMLINMPFADVRLPSLALLQLQGILRQHYADQVEVEIRYANNHLARFLGLNTYQAISNSSRHIYAGVGDWFFRQVAFPDVADNTERYFRRFYRSASPATHDFKARLLDKRQGLEYFLQHLIDLYRLDEADIVGFTSMFTQNLACLALARLLKARRPEMVTVMGGANCEAPMGPMLVRLVPYIDYVFSGPALHSFVTFVGHHLCGTPAACARIDGVFTAHDAADGSHKAALGTEVGIETAIPLDYAHFLRTFQEHFPSGLGKPSLLFETSRGCWWGERAHCTFCGLNGQTMRFRSMSAARAREQFAHLFAHSPHCTHFESVDNIMPASYLTDVFPELRPPDEVSIFYEVRSDLSFEELGVLSRAHVRLIQPGIEALATSTLQLMRKGTTAANNVRFLRDCLTHAIRPSWNLLVGFPGETASVYQAYLKVIPHLVHLFPPSGVAPVRFDRYSPYFTEAEHYGLHLRPYDYYDYIYPFDPPSIVDLAYHFRDRNLAAPYVMDLGRWYGHLCESVKTWILRWRNGPPPQLHFVGESASGLVYDSRCDEATTYDIGVGGRRLLEFCTLPRRLSTLRTSYADSAWETDLERLRAHHLVFEDEGRLVSLVLPHACQLDSAR